MAESDCLTIDAMDKFLNYQVKITHNDTMQRPIVKYRKRDDFDNPVGNSCLNYFLDTRRYEVLIPDVTVK